jgi:predicted Zn-dependent protease
MRPGGEIKDDASKPLQQLADRIQQQCVDLPYPLNVEVVDDQTVNALAMPGGNIVIFSGLLEAAESENELAFVLAHEMGHFVNRDHLTSMGRGLVFLVISSAVFGSDSVIGKRVGEMLMLSELGFSRQHETMADTFALQTVNCFYGHVAGSTSFFEHTGEMAAERFAGHYLSSHPLHRQRVAELKKLAAEQGFRAEGELKPVSPFKSALDQPALESEQADEGISENI